jgi:hypothetical protein
MKEGKQEMVTRQQKKPGVFLDPRADVVFKKIFGQHPDLIKSFLLNTGQILGKSKVWGYWPRRERPVE